MLGALGFFFRLVLHDSDLRPSSLLHAALLALLSIVAIAAVVSFLFVRKPRVFLDPGGITGERLLWGGQRRMSWDQIEKITRSRLTPFAPHLCVHAIGGGRSISVPLYLRDLQSFLETIARMAPSDNALTTYLHANCFR